MERGEAQRKPFAEALNGRLSENYAGDTYTQIKKDNRGLEARPSVFYFSSFNLFSYTSTFSTRFPSPRPFPPNLTTPPQLLPLVVIYNLEAI